MIVEYTGHAYTWLGLWLWLNNGLEKENDEKKGRKKDCQIKDPFNRGLPLQDRKAMRLRKMAVGQGWGGRLDMKMTLKIGKVTFFGRWRGTQFDFIQKKKIIGNIFLY